MIETTTLLAEFQIGDRTCVRCGHIGPLDDYRQDREGKWGKRNLCNDCGNQQSRDSYNKNPERRRELQKETMRQRRIARRAFIQKAKSVPCNDCGKTFPPYVMDFDHRNSNDKTMDVSQMTSRSLTEIQAEIEKCDVVCSNCHRIRTHGNTQNEKQRQSYESRVARLLGQSYNLSEGR